jgi:hypothetical protein
MAQVVECLVCEFEALSSNPSLPQNNKINKKILFLCDDHRYAKYVVVNLNTGNDLGQRLLAWILKKDSLETPVYLLIISMWMEE